MVVSTVDPAAENMMERRDFLRVSGIGLGMLLAPVHGRAIAAEELVSRIDVALKKRLADSAT